MSIHSKPARHVSFESKLSKSIKKELYFFRDRVISLKNNQKIKKEFRFRNNYALYDPFLEGNLRYLRGQRGSKSENEQMLE